MMLWVVSYDPADAPRLQAFEKDAQEFLKKTFAESSHQANVSLPT